MSSRVFYGVCKTAEDIVNKVVYVREEDLLNDTLNFERGDLLVVYFSSGNIQSNPTIVVKVGNAEQESSTSTDTGRYVKSHDIVADMIRAWRDGETVIFTYTQQGSSNIYYWELVNAGHASNSVYGVTKLNGDSEVSLTDWMESSSDDYITAMTPGIFKRIYSTLTSGDSSEEEESQQQIIGLRWVPNSEYASLPQDELGKLKIMNGDGIPITFPIRDLITNEMGTIPSKTSDLTNDGIGDSTGGFITHLPASNVGFGFNEGIGYVNEGNIQLRFVPKGENDYVLVGNDGNGGPQGIKLLNSTSVAGALTVTGQIDGNSNIKGITLYENNVSLIDKYSPKLLVLNYTSPLLTYPTHSSVPTANASDGHAHSYITQEDYNTLLTAAGEIPQDWQAIGVLGYNIDGSQGDAAAAQYCNVWECKIIESQGTDSREIPGRIQYGIYNTRGSQVSIYIRIAILFQKIL